MAIIFDFGLFFFALLTKYLNSLSAFWVTEHVLITYISAFSLNETLLYPLFSKSLEIDDVSE